MSVWWEVIKMRKLLSADFARLWKDKVFWLELLFMLGLGVFVVCTRYSDKARYGTNQPLDYALLAYITFAGCCAAVFCSLFDGTEYSDGTIRNKLIVGHRRWEIYLSGWLTGIAAVFLMCAAFLLSYCTFGFLLLDASEAPLEQIIFYAAISFFTAAAYVSLFHVLSMLVSKKATSAVLCLLIFLGLFMLAMMIQSRLDAPEFVSNYSMTINGIEQAEPEPNPKYLQPAARKVYQFFLDLLPSGQSIELSAFRVPHPVWMIIDSLVICVITTFLGILVFRKKNLK